MKGILEEGIYRKLALPFATFVRQDLLYLLILPLLPPMQATKEIIKAAIALLSESPDGFRYSELVKRIRERLPEIPENTIKGIIWNLDARDPDQVYKPARGLFVHTKFRFVAQASSLTTIVTGINEESFYQPFADWLVNELEECTKAIPLGGNIFKDKWGTPDVIGIWQPRPTDIIKGNIEVISAEIKIDTTNLVTAFGQACCYKLFSHKSYLVIPKASPDSDAARIDSLCMIFGIGLVLFNNQNPDQPEFEIRVRATKHEPDMFYLNHYLDNKDIKHKLFT